MVSPNRAGVMLGDMRCAPLLLLAAACGSGTVTASTFPAAFARAVCEVQARCRGEARYLEQQCEGDAAALYGADLSKALAAGKSKFDAAQAQACVDGLRARGCERTPPEVDQACERAIAGTIAAGSSCNWLYECATGRCDPSGPGVCPATCAAVSEEGQPCSPACDLRAGLRCIDNVCSKLHTLDQKCASNSDCALDLFCDGFGKCSARFSQQASCDAQGQCAPGLFCDLQPNGGLCRKQIANGASCAAAAAGSIVFACVDGSVCKGFVPPKSGASSGTCATTGEIGADCVASAQVTGCGDGLDCVNGKCADKPVSGPCAQPDDCKDGVAWCDGAQCRLLEAAGAACTGASQCASHFCDGTTGQCAEPAGSCHEP